MDGVPAIETPRLLLVPLSEAALRAFLSGDRAEAQRLCGFLVPPGCGLLGDPWIERRLEMMRKDPSQRPWLNRAIVLKAENALIGNINFHHKAPDPDLLAYSPNAAELGYRIEEPRRRNGYARESALAMLLWAAERKAESFFLSIGPGNVPSLRLAASLGFRKTGERMDEIDGLEHVFRAEAETVRAAALSRLPPGRATPPP